MKGSAGYVGALKLRDLCAEAQNFKDGSAQQKEELIEEIQNEFLKVKDYLVASFIEKK
jgi:HPt (histidine-containing phosphotransfer) domain-containing protein